MFDRLFNWFFNRLFFMLYFLARFWVMLGVRRLLVALEICSKVIMRGSLFGFGKHRIMDSGRARVRALIVVGLRAVFDHSVVLRGCL
jgi:hypothetical protein